MSTCLSYVALQFKTDARPQHNDIDQKLLRFRFYKSGKNVFEICRVQDFTLCILHAQFQSISHYIINISLKYSYLLNQDNPNIVPVPLELN